MVGAAGPDGGAGLGAALGAVADVSGVVMVTIQAGVDVAALEMHRDPGATRRTVGICVRWTGFGIAIWVGDAGDIHDVVALVHVGKIGVSAG